MSNCIPCSTAHRFIEQLWNALKLPYFLLDLLRCLLVVVSSVSRHCLPYKNWLHQMFSKTKLQIYNTLIIN